MPIRRAAPPAGHFEQLVGARDQGDLDAINDLAHQLQDYPDKRALKASTDRLRDALTKLTNVMHSMGMDQPGGLQANLNKLQDGADRFAGGSRQVADGGGSTRRPGQTAAVPDSASQRRSCCR